MGDIVKDTVSMVDGGSNGAGSFGYSNYGLVDVNKLPPHVQTMVAQHMGGQNTHQHQSSSQNGAGYSVNQQIQNKTRGASSFQLTINCAKNGTGSGNTVNPVFLYGVSAFSNTLRPYNAVQSTSPALEVDPVFVNNKNALNFVYSPSSGNSAVYTVSLGTKGEYPFNLNDTRGAKKLHVTGMQIEVSDSTFATQLTQGIQTFELDSFGKSTVNDLTTPKDLYQFNQNGVFIPFDYVVSDRKGIILNVLEGAFQLTAYVWAHPIIEK